MSKIIVVINSIFAALLLLSYVLPFIPPKTFAILSVLSLAVPLLIVINIAFVVYWLLRGKRQFLTSAVALAIGFLAYGSVYKFSKSNTEKANSQLNVMNYNVRLFNLYNWIKNDSVEANITSFLKQRPIDVLCLQEYRANSAVDLSFLNYKYEHFSKPNSKFGQAIYSRYPIINSGSIAFPKTANNAIFIDIVKAKDTIRIYNIHLESLRINPETQQLDRVASEKLLKRVSETFKMQQFQTELFLLHKNQCPYKKVILGDFNTTEFSYVYRQIKGDMQDAFKVSGQGFGRTYDFKFFPVRIDFILADNTLEVQHFETFSNTYSDHFPIQATLNLE